MTIGGLLFIFFLVVIWAFLGNWIEDETKTEVIEHGTGELNRSSEHGDDSDNSDTANCSHCNNSKEECECIGLCW